MHRIAEGFDLPANWGAFTNVGMTLDTATPLFGLGSAKYNAANVEYATAPILPGWAAYYTFEGLHFKQANVASSTPNWIFGWRSEGVPATVVEGGCIGVVNSRLCLALGGPSPTIVKTGTRLLVNDALYHMQVELWYAQYFGWVKIKLNNKTINDLVFTGVTALPGEAFLSQVWIGSLYGGGSGNCWVDDFVLNDQQQFQNSDFRWPGMTIVQSVPVSGAGAYNEWTDEDGEQVTTEELTAIELGQEEGVAGTPIVATNGKSGTAPVIISCYGPITNPVFENSTTSEDINFTGTVPSGSRLIVNTQAHSAFLAAPHPSIPLVLVLTDWLPFISGTPDWFRLEPGANNIEVNPAGANVVIVAWVGWDDGPKDSFTYDPKPAVPTPPTGSAGLAAVDHVYRCSLTGAELSEYKIITGIRRSAVDTWDPQRVIVESPHIFPEETMAAQIHRMRRDPSTTTPWTAANIDGTSAIFKSSNYNLADQ